MNYKKFKTILKKAEVLVIRLTEEDVNAELTHTQVIVFVQQYLIQNNINVTNNLSNLKVIEQIINNATKEYISNTYNV